MSCKEFQMPFQTTLQERVCLSSHFEGGKNTRALCFDCRGSPYLSSLPSPTTFPQVLGMYLKQPAPPTTNRPHTIQPQ